MKKDKILMKLYFGLVFLIMASLIGKTDHILLKVLYTIVMVKSGFLFFEGKKQAH